MTAHSINTMRRVRRIHFIGIGGAGMGGIAEVLFHEGYAVSGSDLSDNVMTQRLNGLGIPIQKNHRAENVSHADVVVISSAISPENPELIAARERHIPIVKRAEMLGELMRFRYGIAIAGTHGKTTTTSLVTSLLSAGGLDPTFVIGGLLNSAGCNAKLGESEYLVAEADESDASFLYLHPMIAIVTNIDADHMSTYHNDFEQLRQTFIRFLHNLPFYGLAVLCIDDPVVKSIVSEVSRPIMTYGFDPSADVCAVDFKQVGIHSHFTIQRKGLLDLDVTLNLPGRHNVLNALASFIVANELSIPHDDVTRALGEFQGVGRRFQIHGDFTIAQSSFTLIDDYGHHPREIAATLRAIREAWPDRRLVMTYQPHRYSRTQELFSEFVDILSTVDQLVLLDIYSAGEAPIDGVNSFALCEKIKAIAKNPPIHVSDKATLLPTLHAVLKPNDLLLMQGAGDIGAYAARFAKEKFVLPENA